MTQSEPDVRDSHVNKAILALHQFVDPNDFSDEQTEQLEALVNIHLDLKFQYHLLRETESGSAEEEKTMKMVQNLEEQWFHIIGDLSPAELAEINALLLDVV